MIRLALAAALLAWIAPANADPVSIVASAIAATSVSVGLGVMISFSVGKFLAGIALSYLAQQLSKPKAADPAATMRGRDVMIRSAVEACRTIYGRARVSGPIVWAGNAGGDRQFLFLVVALAGHECSALDETWVNDTALGPLDGDGLATSGRYANLVRVTFHAGAADQAVDSNLANVFPAQWTADHRLRGICYVVVRLLYDQDSFPFGVPNLSFLVRGKKLYDPRTLATAWSENPALIVRDWLTSADGLGCASAEIDDTQIAAAANICDERVRVPAVSRIVEADASSDELDASTGVRLFQWGDGVRFTTTGTLPAGLSLATTYYVVQPGKAGTFNLATSFANAMAGTAIDITSAGSGTHTMERYDQVRYAGDTVFALDQGPLDVLELLLSAMAGAAVYSMGVWRVHAAAYSTPTVTLTADDLAGPVELQPRPPRSDVYNAVKGTFVSPRYGWKATDFPGVSNATYATQDGGDVIYRDLVLPATICPVMAQRIARLVLEQSRQAMVLRLACNLQQALALQPMDSVMLTLSQLGFAAKVFRVVGWDFSGPVNLLLQEEASALYDFDYTTDATDEDLADDTTLPDPFTVGAPSNLNLDSGEDHLLITGSGAVLARILASWDAPADAYVVQYEVQAKPAAAAESAWAPVALVPAGTVQAYVSPVDDGAAWDVRVRAINAVAVRSEWITVTGHVVIGNTAAPPAPDSFTVARGADGTRVFAWSQASIPADVRSGGGWQIRYHATETDWDAMTALHTGLLVASPAERNEPAAGTWNFAIRTVDSTGNESASVLATSVVLGDPRLKNVLLQRADHELGWPGTIGSMWLHTVRNHLRAVADTGGKIADLAATIGGLAATFNTPLSTRVSPVTYTTEVMDVGADTSFTPVVSWTGNGSATIEMKTGTTADGTVTGAFAALAHVTGKRYCQIRITLTGTACRLESLTTLLDGETVTDVFEDVNTATETASWFASTAAGHFKVGSRSGDLAAIQTARITALQNVGAGWSWELLNKSSTVDGQPAAEFKVYNGSGTLADAVIDVELTGPKAS